MDLVPGLKFCGNPVTQAELSLIRELLTDLPNISQTEFAATVCEVLDWLRPNGLPKTVECLHFLQGLAQEGLIVLQEVRQGRPKGSQTRIQRTAIGSGKKESPLALPLRAVRPLSLEQVRRPQDLQLWKEYVDRFHYLGFKVPFGAQLRYFVKTPGLDHQTLACLQFSSPAWTVAARDRWIGWNARQRIGNLQFVIQNSRFLILPWIRIPHLASHILSLAVKRVGGDWERQYRQRPLLVETFVDSQRFAGTCYKAANWTCLGTTRGRGRMDRHTRKTESVKSIWVYPLRRGARQRLRRLHQVHP